MPISYFRKVRQRCWELIDREYPEEKDKYAIVRDLVAKSLKEDCVVLDAGCGHRTSVPENDFLRVCKIGIDMVLEDIRENESIDLGILSNLNNIPLKSESVDVVLCNMVFEHLDYPDNVFLELNRIIKKDGYLIFMTPCIYNIVTVINRMIPNRFHKKVGHFLTGVSESDIFPTRYKANSIATLRKLLEKNNFKGRDLIMYQPPPYAFVFSAALCKTIIYYYKIINKYERLKFLRGVIIARYQKI